MLKKNVVLLKDKYTNIFGFILKRDSQLTEFKKYLYQINLKILTFII